MRSRQSEIKQPVCVFPFAEHSGLVSQPIESLHLWKLFQAWLCESAVTQPPTVKAFDIAQSVGEEGVASGKLHSV